MGVQHPVLKGVESELVAGSMNSLLVEQIYICPVYSDAEDELAGDADDLVCWERHAL